MPWIQERQRGFAVSRLTKEKCSPYKYTSIYTKSKRKIIKLLEFQKIMEYNNNIMYPTNKRMFL